MTKEELFKAIGDLEESLLDENVQQIEKKHHLHIFAAIAACAVVCIGAVGLSKLAASPQMPIGNPVPIEETTESTTKSTTETMTEGTTEFEGFLLHHNFLCRGRRSLLFLGRRLFYIAQYRF